VVTAGACGIITVAILWALKPSDAVCALIPPFGGLGMVAVLSAFITKLVRVYRLLSNPALITVKIADSELLMYIGSILAVEVLLLIVWSAIPSVRLRPHPHVLNVNLELLLCGSEKDPWVFFSLQIAYITGLLIAALVLCILTRKVHRHVLYYESRMIAWTTLGLSVCCLVFVVGVPLLVTNLHATLAIVAISTLVAGGTVAALLLHFKLLAVAAGWDQKSSSLSKHSEFSTNFKPEDITADTSL